MRLLVSRAILLVALRDTKVVFCGAGWSQATEMACMEIRPAGFIGTSQHSLDQKNRLHLPKRILDRLTPEEKRRLYLVRGWDRCVALYPPEEWKRFSNRFHQSMPATKKARNFVRLFFASVAEVSVDSQGRILLPEHLRELAEIRDKTVVNGVGDHVEIWSAERWAGIQEEDSDAFEQAYEELSTQNLGGPA